MHPIEMRVIDFMKRINASATEVEEKLLKPASKDVDYFIKKLYEDDPNRPFTIRMSNIGRPLCQLQMAKMGASKVDSDWNFSLRMMYGGVIEGLAVNIMRHAGVDIESEQEQVALHIGGITINGTLDVVIDGKVWDIKSASEYAFKEKFSSYEALKASDDFGYVAQLFGYAAAKGILAGGWIVINKSSGELKICEVGSTHDEDMAAALNLIAANVKALTSNAFFERKFTDKAETFKKQLTGNRVLESPCMFCDHRYVCWDGLQHKPSVLSTAYEKPWKYYTECREV